MNHAIDRGQLNEMWRWQSTQQSLLFPLRRAYRLCRFNPTIEFRERLLDAHCGWALVDDNRLPRQI